MKKLILAVLLSFAFTAANSQNYVACNEDTIRANYAKYVDVLYSSTVKTVSDSSKIDIIYVFKNQKRFYSMAKYDGKYWCYQYKILDFNGDDGYKDLLKSLYDNLQYVVGTKNDNYKKGGNIVESWLYADEFNQPFGKEFYFRWLLYKYNDMSIVIVDFLKY